ncbi:MAG: hypothetical protein AB8C95_06525 [Phycisphaeraceae bacterium]
MAVLDNYQELMAAYFAGVLDHVGSDRLADWICESEANVNTFARFAIEHHALEHFLRVEKYGDIASLSQHDFTDTNETSLGLTELEELKLLSEMEEKVPLIPVVLEQPATVLRPTPWPIRCSVRTATRQSVIVFSRRLFWGSFAAMLLIGLFIAGHFVVQQAEPAASRPVVLNESTAPPQVQVVAILEGQSDPKWLDGESRSNGSSLIEGDYRLSEGTIRIRFDNGALVYVEGPSRFSLDSGSMITLEEGRLVSHCEDRAHGFCVRTPYGDFIDLGTEFGVSVSPWRESQLHVFEGEVKAVSSSPRDSLGSDSRIVRTSEAVAIGPIHSGVIQPLAQADPNLFDTVRRRFVASINTGSLMDQDNLDQQWLVTQLNQRPINPPLPAVLFVPPTREQLKFGPVSRLPKPIFLPNQVGQLCWIKPNASLLSQDVATTTYSTSFDLEGYVASTAWLDLGFNADNFVSAIRLNGKSVPLPEITNMPNVSPYAQLNRIKIQDGFLPGRNQVEIVVTNGKPDARPTYTGLVAELSITAQPDWITAPEQRPRPN